MSIKRNLIYLTGSVILLASCATTTTNYYRSSVESWQGASVKALVKQWGRPDYKILSPDGDAMLAYRTQSYSPYMAPTSPAIGVNNRGGRPVISVDNLNHTWNRGQLSLTCVAIFKINPVGVVTGTQVQGNSCYGGSSFASQYANKEKGGNK
jgi:hypothetical protein